MGWLDTIKLGFGSSLIIGHLPKKATFDQLYNKMAKEQHDYGKFGFFDSSSPNFTTYYPEVTAEDFNPKAEDFIQPIFRALSEVVVHKGWNPVDFSKEGVLKKSMGLLVGQAINADHETSIGNAMGAVADVSWQDGYTSKGIKVPAGINAQLKIDGKSNPRIARGILMDPPSIHSSSVTVRFIWEKSHPEMTEEEFFRNLGGYDKDGKLITRVASLIKNYNEISLVGHGADPFAQKTNEDGKIVNPHYAGVAYNSAEFASYRKQEKYFWFDMKVDLISNEEKRTIPPDSNDTGSQETQIKNENMNPTLLAFAAAFALKANDNETEAQFQVRVLAAIEALKIKDTAHVTELSTRDTEIGRLKAIETTYNNEKTTLMDSVANKAFRDATLLAARTKTLGLYNKVMDNKPVQAITDMINNSNLDALDALNTEYAKKLDDKYPQSCKKCGSTEISRVSSAVEDEDDEEDTTKNKSKEDVMATLRNKAKKKNLQLRSSYEAPTKK